MPRGKAGKYALAEDGDGGLTPVRVDGPGSGIQDVPGVQKPSLRAEAAIWAITTLDLRIDGWLRLIPSGDGKVCYAKWKFSRGKHKGKYVMWQAQAGDILAAIVGVAEKVNQVDEGTLKPAMDTFYDPT